MSKKLNLAEKVEKKFEKFSKGKILTKSKSTKPLNAEKAILQGTGNLKLVREVENPYSNPVQDNRSLYFKDSFIKERSENRKWLS